jgi:predicted XRE-type DNA-binding protein
LPPEEALAKAELARRTGAIIERRGLTQAVAGEIFEVDQPKVSALQWGRLAGFSLGRLVRSLVLLGNDVKIVRTPRATGAGPARVIVA